MRTTISRSRLAIAACMGAMFFAPMHAPRAQGEAPRVVRTHLVRPGETLWSLAVMYLGDGRRWRELVVVDGTAADDPLQLSAGSRIVLPTGARRHSGRATKIANGAIIFAPNEVSAGEDRPHTPTVFFGRNFQSVVLHAPPIASSGSQPSDSITGSLAWHQLTAPFLVEPREIASAPRLEASREVRIVGAIDSERLLMLQDRVRIAGVADGVLKQGTRALAFKAPTAINGHGTLILPTGVLAIEGAPSVGVRDARVLTIVDVMTEGQGVLPLADPAPSFTTAGPAPTMSGLTGRVLWVEHAAELPSLQHIIVVDLDDSTGLRPGDQVTIYDSGPDSTGTTMSSEQRHRVVLAIASVLRVTPRGASAMVIQQMQPGIREGSVVRVTAKLP